LSESSRSAIGKKVLRRANYRDTFTGIAIYNSLAVALAKSGGQANTSECFEAGSDGRMSGDGRVAGAKKRDQDQGQLASCSGVCVSEIARLSRAASTVSRATARKSPRAEASIEARRTLASSCVSCSRLFVVWTGFEFISLNLTEIRKIVNKSDKPALDQEFTIFLKE
jgi:hypothetical protein